MERSEQRVKDFEHISQLALVFLYLFEQVNTSWGLRASFIDKTEAFFSFF